MRKTILIVDDSHARLATLGRRLAQAGYLALLSDSGEEALSLIATRKVDCVLLDAAMRTVLPALREIAGAPVVTITPDDHAVMPTAALRTWIEGLMDETQVAREIVHLPPVIPAQTGIPLSSAA